MRHMCVFHISSEITEKRRAAYFDDKQHGRDLSAAQQIRWRDRGKGADTEEGRAGRSDGQHAKRKGDDEEREKGNLKRKRMCLVE